MRKSFLVTIVAGVLTLSLAGCTEIGSAAADAAGKVIWDAGTKYISDSLGSASESPKETTETGTGGISAEYGIPVFSGDLVAVVNNNKPFFTDDEIKDAAAGFENYSDLDAYGRCGAATASVCTSTMPTEERGDISSIHPTGWWGMKESTIGPERCHLIAYMLTGENANEKNLVTGTHSMNVTGMLAYESKVKDQIDNYGGHVLYRVTPDFWNYDELCHGVLMEAKSVEDNGKSLSFCVYIYNVQNEWDIDYTTGTAEYTGESTAVIDDTAYGDASNVSTVSDENATFVLNVNSKKIHLKDCSVLEKTALRNKNNTDKTLEELETEGYTPCGVCLGED